MRVNVRDLVFFVKLLAKVGIGLVHPQIEQPVILGVSHRLRLFPLAQLLQLLLEVRVVGEAGAAYLAPDRWLLLLLGFRQRVITLLCGGGFVSDSRLVVVFDKLYLGAVQQHLRTYES